MRKCWNCGQPTDDDNSRVCSDEICQRAEKKSRNGEFRKKIPERDLREYLREYRQRPGNKAKLRKYQREYQQRPKAKAKSREYRERPEVKAKRLEYARKYNQLPEVIKRRRERARKYYQRNKKLREEE